MSQEWIKLIGILLIINNSKRLRNDKMDNKNKRILDSRPLVLSAELATKIGLNEAIFLQQLTFWLKRTKNGKNYVYKTYEEWKKEFPFWSESTIKRAVAKLKKMELIKTQRINQSQLYFLNNDKFDNYKKYMIEEKYANELLIKNRPLLLFPELAVEIGLNEAIFLQQLYYWRTITKHEGKYVHKKTKEWKKELPFIHENTINKVINNLINMGLITVEQKMYTRNFYINDDELNKLREKLKENKK